MTTKEPLAKAAKNLETIENLLSRFGEQRTVGQHERLAFKIVGQTVELNHHLAEHILAIRKRTVMVRAPAP